MRKFSTIATLLLCAMASGCATQDTVMVQPAPPRVVEVPQARLPEPPASLMEREEPNFRSRLLEYFSKKPTEPTPSSGSSAAPKN